MQTDWMQDESLKNIPPHKLNFLQTLLFESSSLKKEQLLPFLMNLAKQSQEQKVTFTDDEINAIIQVLKKYATPEEMNKMEKLLAMKRKRLT